MERKKAQKAPFLEINWRKLMFFSAVFLVVFFGWKVISTARFSADEPGQDVSTLVTSSTVNLEVRQNGSVYKNGTKISSKISAQKNFDELRMVVYDKNGFYLDNLEINLTLPAVVANQSNPQILAIHGVDSANAEAQNDTTIIYKANGVGADSTITIVAQLPKGVINLPFWQQFIFLLSSFGSSVWLTVAIIIPLLTLIYLILLISLHQKSQRISIPDRPISAPPMAIPPAVVGVLSSQEIGPREIAATLIDLALRKFIFIIDRDRGFAFGKRTFNGPLLGFEKFLLSKIFRDSIKISQQEVSERFNNHLYSHKMSLFTSGIYALSTRLGYFKENPASMHRKYQFIGIVLFFFALICFFLSFKYFPSLPYAAFLWVGMMVASIIFIIVGSQMPIRTALGRQALSNWLAFKKYLSDPTPLPNDSKNFQKFVEYLPYAIIFHCEALWARRFSEDEFMIPDWFITDKEGLGLQDFCLSLYPIIGYVGQNLATIREPGYK
ncbi:MAG: DUF2207 domain-containing protein [Candidatus Berkelbacteria bacterium]|nr:DUF2207 domain-containing protein [Candidatus Berkelbacteria bacterium]